MTFMDKNIDRIKELISKEYGIKPVEGQRASNNLGGAREIRFRVGPTGAEKSVILNELLGPAIEIKMFDGRVGVFKDNSIKWK